MKRMKGIFTSILVMLGVWLVADTAEAAPSPGRKISSGKGGNFGLGLSLGDPMGLSMKGFLAPNHAIQGDLGWAPLHHGDGRLGFDYLWHPGVFASGPVAEFLPYLGLGIGMMFWADRCYYGDRYYYGDRGRGYYGRCGNGGVAMFIRAPILGLGVHWKKAPLDTMFEGSWSPYIVYPDLAHGDFSFKIRYYF